MAEIAPNVSLRPLTEADRPLIKRLWQLYWHDLSQSRGSMPNADGLFKQEHLERYLGDSDAYPGFLVRYNDQPTGFAFVTGANQTLRTIGDFFVVRALRRRGVGRWLARELINRYPGRWEIAFQAENPGAPEFWRGVVSDIVGSAWTEELRPVSGKPRIPPDHWLTFTLEK